MMLSPAYPSSQVRDLLGAFLTDLTHQGRVLALHELTRLVRDAKLP